MTFDTNIVKLFMDLRLKNNKTTHYSLLTTNNGGYIILLSALIIGAVALAVTLSVILLSLDAHRTSLAILQSNQAKALANACAESGLEAIRDDDTFTGTSGLTLSTGTCSYTVTNLGGETRNVESTGTTGTVIRKVEVDLDTIYPNINITSWQEVANF